MLAYFKLNLAASMEYRASFLAQSVGMALNDALAFFFWWVYFQHFPQVGGWGLRDLFLLWGILATSVGVASVVFGNAHRLSNVISQGQLDYYLGLPWNPLLHVLVSRTSLAGWGDVGFGFAAFAVAAWLDVLPVGLATILTALSTAVVIGFVVLVGSLAFFMGNAEAAAFQAPAVPQHQQQWDGSFFRPSENPEAASQATASPDRNRSKRVPDRLARSLAWRSTVRNVRCGAFSRLREAAWARFLGHQT